MKVAICQSAPVPGDVNATLAFIAESVRKSGKNGYNAELIIFPELFITGYFPELWESRPTPADELYWIEQLRAVAETESISVLCGHPSYRAQTKEYGRSSIGKTIAGNGSKSPLYNAASFVSRTGSVETVAKVHLFGSESLTFAPGDVFPILDTEFGKISIQICYDLEFPESARSAALAGAEVILYPSNNMHPFAQHHQIYTMARAMENSTFVIYCNRIGSELGVEFCGGSGVAHPMGTWIAAEAQDSELLFFELNLKDRASLDASLNYHLHRKPWLYLTLTD